MQTVGTRRPRRDAENNAHPTQSSHAVGSRGTFTRFRASRANAPIHSLPLELLGEIFILALPTIHELYKRHIDEGKKRTNPFVLCAVCSSWRFLAFCTPQLWMQVFIRVPIDMTKDQARKKAADLVPWIERSRTLPLTLHISCDFDKSLDGTGPEAPIVSVLNDYSTRWQSLYLQDYFLPFSMPQIPSSPKPLPLFHFDRWCSLRQISSFCRHRVPLTNKAIPWAQLTRLQVQGQISCQAAETIFMECPKLVQLSISVNPTLGMTGVPIILHDLVTFSLGAVQCLPMLVHRLSLPSLRDIFLDVVWQTDIKPLLNFFTRSSCTLNNLKICGSDLTSSDYLDVLAHRSCNSLTSLIMCSIYWLRNPPFIDDEVLRRLTLHRNDTLCPCLKFLTIDLDIQSSSHSTLLNMVKSRFHAGQSPLQYLYFKVERLNNFGKLYRIGKRSGMEYTRQKLNRADDVYSVLLRRRGVTMQLPP
ncbi:hypothetical protein F5887DRAFT_45881 [Amanita rubescens]|nr:hypothetical protein F5887DRAFT_45881 [Amanita rubescens]